jgi:hypothetical protein
MDYFFTEASKPGYVSFARKIYVTIVLKISIKYYFRQKKPEKTTWALYMCK